MDYNHSPGQITIKIAKQPNNRNKNSGTPGATLSHTSTYHLFGFILHQCLREVPALQGLPESKETLMMLFLTCSKMIAKRIKKMSSLVLFRCCFP